METTVLFKKNLVAYNKKERFIINQGGARAGKTYSILQLLFLICLSSKESLIISVVSQTVPHLKKGAIRDFEKIVINSGIDFYKHYNKSEMIFSYNKSIIEFFSVENSGRVLGPGRDILFINECNYTNYEVFEHLEIRTRGTIFLDFNPLTKFWVHSELIDKGIEHTFIHSTYKDNNQLDKRIVEAIERKKDNENWWRVYGLGLIGFSEEIIFNEYKLKRFSMTDLEQFKEIETTVSYTDIAYGGGDYFCSVFAKVVVGKVYIHDVIFTKSDTTITEPLLIEKLKKHQSRHFGVEANNGGKSIGLRIYNNVSKHFKTNVYTPTATANKIVRIITEATTILDNFYFRNDYEAGSDYYRFMNNLTSFNTDDKNKNDDAPDCVAGLCKLMRIYLHYSKTWLQ